LNDVNKYNILYSTVLFYSYNSVHSGKVYVLRPHEMKIILNLNAHQSLSRNKITVWIVKTVLNKCTFQLPRILFYVIQWVKISNI